MPRGNRNRANLRDVKTIAFQVRAPETILRWVDRQALQMGLSRNQLLLIILRSSQAHFEAAEDAGLFKNIEAVVDRAVRESVTDISMIIDPKAPL